MYWRGKPIGDGSALEMRRGVKALGGSTPSPSAKGINKMDIPNNLKNKINSTSMFSLFAHILMSEYLQCFIAKCGQHAGDIAEGKFNNDAFSNTIFNECMNKMLDIVRNVEVENEEELLILVRVMSKRSKIMRRVCGEQGKDADPAYRADVLFGEAFYLSVELERFNFLKNNFLLV